MSSKQNRKISGKRSFSSTSESSSPLKKKTKREKTRYRKLPKISKNSKNRTLPNRKFGKTTKSRSKGNFNSEKATTEKKRNFKKEIDKKKKIDKVIDEKSSDKTITEKMPLEKKSHKVDSSKSEKKLDGVKNISLKEKLFIKPAKKIKSIKMSFKSSFPLKNAISSINKSNFKNPKTIKNENKNSQQKNFDGENSKLSQINNKSPIEKSDKTESKSRRKSENSNNGGWSTTKRPLRNFLQVKKMISTFNEELAEKIDFDVIRKMDVEPSSISLANKFFASHNEFKELVIVNGEIEDPVSGIIVENVPFNLTLQTIGDWFNSNIQTKMGTQKEMIKNVSNPAQLKNSILIILNEHSAMSAALSLNGSIFGNFRINVFPAPKELISNFLIDNQQNISGKSPIKINTKFNQKSQNWDKKNFENGGSDWRTARDAIINSDLPENRKSGYPIVISNISHKGTIEKVIEILNNELDQKFSYENGYINDVRELSEGTIIVLAKSKEFFEGILSLKDHLIIDSRSIFIRPFIDDGSINIDNLRRVPIQNFTINAKF